MEKNGFTSVYEPVKFFFVLKPLLGLWSFILTSLFPSFYATGECYRLFTPSMSQKNPGITKARCSEQFYQSLGPAVKWAGSRGQSKRLYTPVHPPRKHPRNARGNVRVDFKKNDI